jgi:hypothetical protein
VPTLLAPFKRCDLHSVGEQEARARLKTFLTPAAKPPRGRFPGETRTPFASSARRPMPRFPGIAATPSGSDQGDTKAADAAEIETPDVQFKPPNDHQRARAKARITPRPPAKAVTAAANHRSEDAERTREENERKVRKLKSTIADKLKTSRAALNALASEMSRAPTTAVETGTSLDQRAAELIDRLMNVPFTEAKNWLSHSHSQNPLSRVTSCRRPSSAQRPASSSEDPIQNRPGGIQRRRWLTSVSGMVISVKRP